MKKQLKIFSLASFVALLAISVFGADLFDSYVNDNDSFTIDGISHSLRYYPSNNKVSLRAGDDVIIISVGDCKTVGALNYCIEDANTTEIDDAQGYREVGRTHLVVTENMPQVTVGIAADRSIIGVDEPSILTVTLENTGEERASEFAFTAKVTPKATIAGASPGISSLGSMATWSGALLPKEKKTISFNVKTTEYKDINVTFDAHFSFMQKVKTIDVSPLHLKVITPVEIEIGMSQESVILNEESIYWVNITNNDKTGSLDVSELQIKVPSGLSITDKSKELEETAGILSTTTSISMGSAKSFYVKFKTFDNGAYNISSVVKSMIHGTAFNDESSATVRVGLADIIPFISVDPARASGGESVLVIITVKNAGSRSINSYNVDVSSNLIPSSGVADESLGAGASDTVFSKTVKVPLVTKETSYFIKVSGSHKNLAGSSLNFDAQKNIIVVPKDLLIETIPSVHVEGNSVKVGLKLKSAKQDLKDVSVVDVVPKGLSTSGKRDADFDSLSKGEEKDALDYTISLPLTYSQKTITIKRSLSATQEDEKLYADDSEVIIDLTVETPTTDVGEDTTNVSADQTASDSSKSPKENATSTVSEETTEAKPPAVGFLGKIIDGIKDFFSGLFSG